MEKFDHTQHPLLGLFDRDPGQWRPQLYGVEISVPVALNGTGQANLVLNNQPFIMTRITHQVVGDTAHASTSGLFQDGMYSIEWKDEMSNYQNGPIMADLMFGNVAAGFSYMLPYPLPYAGNKTLFFRVTNRVLRALTPEADYFTVAICVHGIGNWGTVLPQKGA